MANVYDVKASDVVKLASERLKAQLKKPAYVDYVKSGANKERVPQDPDFYFVRAASIMRQVYLNGPIGVSKLRVRYGSRQEHVVHRRHHVKSGGSVIRDALQGLEKLGYVKQATTGRKGRIITPAGQAFMDKIAKELNTA